MNLEFENDSFDVVIFSFNGIMSIPQQSNRDKALKEVNRVLREFGKFIFTTHDRALGEKYVGFWKEEKEKWDLKKQNPMLFEYGDLITKSKNESSEIYIHIPSQKEVMDWLTKNDFEVIETFYRSEKFDESELIKSKSGECRFWITEKK